MYTPPINTRTPDITTALSSRRAVPPRLPPPPQLVRSSPSAVAARRVRAEALAQVTLNTPSNVPMAASRHSMNPPSYDPRQPSPKVSSSPTKSASPSVSASVSQPVALSAAPVSLPPPSGRSANALLAATDGLTAEQLAGIIAHLNQRLQKKELSDRHVENQLLLHFLHHARHQKELVLRRLRTELDSLSNDITVTETQCDTQRIPFSQQSNPLTVPPNMRKEAQRDDPGMSRKRVRLLKNYDALESHYFNTVGQNSGDARKNALKNFTDDVFKLTRYSRLRDCATLMHVARVPDAPGSDVFKASNIVSSMEFDRDSEFLATAGVTRRIKIFEFSNVMRNINDVHYPIREIPTQAKLSWVCWNPCIRHHLVSSDYEGFVKVWDVNIATAISEYEEHELRAWSVDYCPAKPTYFASGSDDGTVKLWTTTQRNSVLTIDNKPANVCSVKFHPTSAELLAFGSVDNNVHYFDLRSPKEALQVFKSHTRAVSYVKFMSSSELVSASVDSKVKLWDLKTMSLSRTFVGHRNDKNFVGLSVNRDYIACGSEQNTVYCYYKAIPNPLTQYHFSSVDPLTGEEMSEDDELQFISSVCWCPNNPLMLVAANSLGALKVLKLDSDDGAENEDDSKDVRDEDEDDVR